MLVQQFDKIAIISKRQMDFTTTNEKTGAQQEVHQKYVTGFDAVSGTCYSDLSVTDDGRAGNEEHYQDFGCGIAWHLWHN